MSVFYKTKIEEPPERERRVCSSCGAIYRAPWDAPGTTCPMCHPCEGCGGDNLFLAGERHVCPKCRRPE